MKGSGYPATVIGAAVGGFLLAWGVGFIGAVIEIRADPGNGLAGIMGAVVGGTIGLGLGAALGSWVGLRWRRGARAGTTALIVALAAPAATWAGLYGTYTAVYRWFPGYLDHRGPLDWQAVTSIITVACFAASATASRRLALAIRRDPWMKL